MLDVGRVRPTDTAQLSEDYKGLRKGDRGRVVAIDTGTQEVVLDLFPASQSTRMRVPAAITRLTLPTGDPRVSSLATAARRKETPCVHVVVAEMAEDPKSRPIAIALIDEALNSRIDAESVIRWANNRRAADKRRAELDRLELDAAAYWCESRAAADADPRVAAVYTGLAEVLRAAR